MTGAEHAAEAVRLITPTERQEGWSGEKVTTPPSPADVELAKVHATLAQVAIAYEVANDGLDDYYWGEVFK